MIFPVWTSLALTVLGPPGHGLWVHQVHLPGPGPVRAAWRRADGGNGCSGLPATSGFTGIAPLPCQLGKAQKGEASLTHSEGIQGTRAICSKPWRLHGRGQVARQGLYPCGRETSPEPLGPWECPQVSPRTGSASSWAVLSQRGCPNRRTREPSTQHRCLFQTRAHGAPNDVCCLSPGVLPGCAGT